MLPERCSSTTWLHSPDIWWVFFLLALEIRNKTLDISQNYPSLKRDYTSTISFSTSEGQICTGLHINDDWNIKLHPPPLSHFTLQEQHVTRWEGLLAVPRRWSSTCQGLASVIYEASQPQPSLCSRDAGGPSLLKMFFHFLLDLRLSECIKELNLDGETAMHEGLVLYPPPRISSKIEIWLTSAKLFVLFSLQE